VDASYQTSAGSQRRFERMSSHWQGPGRGRRQSSHPRRKYFAIHTGIVEGSHLSLRVKVVKANKRRSEEQSAEQRSKERDAGRFGPSSGRPSALLSSTTSTCARIPCVTKYSTRYGHITCRCGPECKRPSCDVWRRSWLVPLRHPHTGLELEPHLPPHRRLFLRAPGRALVFSPHSDRRQPPFCCASAHISCSVGQCQMVRPFPLIADGKS
jgi:hypothetical protein